MRLFEYKKSRQIHLSVCSQNNRNNYCLFVPVTMRFDKFNKFIYRFIFSDIALHTFFFLVKTHFSTTCTHISVIGVSHFARTIYNTAHDTNFKSFQVRCTRFYTCNYSLQVEHCASTAGASHLFGLRNAHSCTLQYSKCYRVEFFNRDRSFIGKKNSIAKAINKQNTQIGCRLNL